MSRTERVEIRLTPQERQWLEALARADDRSISSMVRALIRQAKEKTMKEGKNPMDEKCTCKNPERVFSEDGLIEWCGSCGRLICDHHLRKFGTPHPSG